MNLWERELNSYKGSLERLDPPGMLAVAVAALERAFTTEPVPYEEPEPKRWLEGAIRAGQSAVAERATRITLPTELNDEFEEIDEEATERGVGQLLMAAITCVDRDALSASNVLDVLFSCYVFTVQRQEPEPLTIEQEEANERCREVIAYHKELIRQATG